MMIEIVQTNAVRLRPMLLTGGILFGMLAMTACSDSSNTTAVPTVGAPAQITVVSGSGVTEAPGSTLPLLSVKVVDASGNPVPQVSVTWTVTAGGGSVASATTATNTTGLATNTWTLGSVGGGTVNTVSATVSDANSPLAPATFTATAGVQLVAQASIEPAGFGWPILTVEIQGQSIPLMLLLGGDGNAMTSTVLNGLNSSGGTLTTKIGTVTQSLTFQSVSGTYGNGSLGYLGGTTLSQFDWVENGPQNSVSLYAKPLQATTQPVWLPAGITVADCVPVQVNTYQVVFFPIRVNGIAFLSPFNSGSRRTDMNLAALTALGLDTLSPNVHPVSFSASYRNETAKWEVTGLRTTLGTHTLAADSATVYPTLGYNTAEVSLGTSTFSDRTLVISYSSKNICVGEP